MSISRKVVCEVPLDVGVTRDRFVAVLQQYFFTGRGCICTFVNPHATYLAKDESFRELLNKFDYVLCDGVGMSIAATSFGGAHTDRLSFDMTSLAPVVFSSCVSYNKKVFLVGGLEGVTERAESILTNLYPGLCVAGAVPGFGASLDLAVDEIIRDKVPVVIVGMGAQKQEAFLLRLKSRGWDGLGFTCGGFFDQLTSSGNYYPIWVDRLNLRFAYRIYKEPRRLARRYFFEYMPFLRSFARSSVGRVFGC